MKHLFGRAHGRVPQKEIKKEEIKEATTFRTQLRAALCLTPSPRRVKIQPRKIYQTKNRLDKTFRVDIDMPTCVHGYLSPDKKQPATLIVFAFQLVCIGKKGSYKRINLDLDFEDTVDGQKCSPEIIAHGPFVKEEEQNVFTKKIEQIFKKELTAHADIFLVAGGTGVKESVSDQRKETFVQRYSGKAASNTRINGYRRTSGIWWNIKTSTNPNNKEETIKPNPRFAVLLMRENKSEFEVRMRLNIDAGWRFKLENRSQDIKIGGQTPNLKFSPSLWYEGNCHGIDRKRLGVYIQDNMLTELTERR